MAKRNDKTFLYAGFEKRLFGMMQRGFLFLHHATQYYAFGKKKRKKLNFKSLKLKDFRGVFFCVKSLTGVLKSVY